MLLNGSYQIKNDIFYAKSHILICMTIDKALKIAGIAFLICDMTILTFKNLH